jgi:hypothetical protein
LSSTAQEFFATVRSIFTDWPSWKSLLKYPEDVPSTDVVYAMAATVLGVENVTLPVGTGPSIVHMKSGIVPVQGTDWTRELVWEADPFRIQTVAQWGYVHYHNKHWRLNCEHK